MGLNDRIDDWLQTRGQKHRRLARKEAARKDAHRHLVQVENRIQILERERDKARREGNEERVRAVTKKLQYARKEAEATRESIERLSRIIPSLKDSIARITSAIKRAKRQAQNSQGINLSAGPTHWGGSDDILEQEVEPVAAKRGLYPNSAKRVETYGNPTSDHHTSQVYASARDFPTANNYSLRDEIMRDLGVGSVTDYGLYYISRGGATFRVQPIAGTHGTGPHLHIGIRRA